MACEKALHFERGEPRDIPFTFASSPLSESLEQANGELARWLVLSTTYSSLVPAI